MGPSNKQNLFCQLKFIKRIKPITVEPRQSTKIINKRPKPKAHT